MRSYPSHLSSTIEDFFWNGRSQQQQQQQQQRDDTRRPRPRPRRQQGGSSVYHFHGSRSIRGIITNSIIRRTTSNYDYRNRNNTNSNINENICVNNNCCESIGIDSSMSPPACLRFCLPKFNLNLLEGQQDGGVDDDDDGGEAEAGGFDDIEGEDGEQYFDDDDDEDWADGDCIGWPQQQTHLLRRRGRQQSRSHLCHQSETDQQQQQQQQQQRLNISGFVINNIQQRLQKRQRRRRKKSPPLLKVDSASGMLQIPSYRPVARDACPLLKHAWDQDWRKVMMRCVSHPKEALCVTEHSRRTVLHLATFNHACTYEVAQALLQANRHMVLVADGNWYTPIHNVCFFPGEALVSLLCDTAIMVEQELQGHGQIPQTNGISPLFLAAKRGAPLSTIRCLLSTRSRTEWIAPSTGGEPYWDANTLDEFSSPLEILLRDRAGKAFSSIVRETEGMTSVDETRVVDDNVKNKNERLRQLFRKVTHDRLLWHYNNSKNNKMRNNSNDIDQHQQEQPRRFLSTSKTPLSLSSHDDEYIEALILWEKCVELLAAYCPLLQVPTNSDSAEEEVTSMTLTGKGRDEDEDFFPFGIVHCVVSAKVPLLSLLPFVLSMFPEQVLQRDQAKGLTPLHHILEAQHPYATSTLVSIILQHTPNAALVSIPRTPLCLALDRKLSFSPTAMAMTTMTSTGGFDGVHRDGVSDGTMREAIATPSTSTSATSIVSTFTATDGPSCRRNRRRNFSNNNNNNNNRSNSNSRTVNHDTTTTVNTNDMTTTTTPITTATTTAAAAVTDIGIVNELLHIESLSTLQMVDPISGLYPFALAASRDYDLNVIYFLLVSNPQVMRDIQ